MARILLVGLDLEDGHDVRGPLERSGHEVVPVADAAAAINEVRRRVPDIVLIDLDQVGPGSNHLLAAMRAEGYLLPVILRTSDPHSAQVADALEDNANDFVHRTVGPEVLIARVSVCLRRAPRARRTDPRIEIDHERQIIRANGRSVHLPPKPFALLQVLLGAGGRVCSKRLLLEQVWMYSPGADIRTHAVETALHELRRALRDIGLGDEIETCKGRGWRWRFGRGADPSNFRKS